MEFHSLELDIYEALSSFDFSFTVAFCPSHDFGFMSFIAFYLALHFLWHDYSVRASARGLIRSDLYFLKYDCLDFTEWNQDPMHTSCLGY